MKKINILFAFLTASFCSYSQDNVAAKMYFTKYLNSKTFTEDCIKALPTLEECKMIFNGANADTFYTYTEGLRNEMKRDTHSILFADVKVISYVSKDFIEDKENYIAGMGRIIDKFQDGLTFYEVLFFKTKGAKMEGMACKYWINIKGRWVLFLFPSLAFK